MTAVVSGERAKATWLTGAAGLLVLAVAIVMMVVAAPAQSRPHHVVTAAAAYPPVMITQSWSAGGSGWVARPPLARSAAS